MKKITIDHDIIGLSAREILPEEPRPIKIMFGKGITVIDCNFGNSEWLNGKGEIMPPPTKEVYIKTIWGSPHGVLLKDDYLR